MGWGQGRDKDEHQQLPQWAQPRQGKTTRDPGAVAPSLLLPLGLDGGLGPGATTGEDQGSKRSLFLSPRLSGSSPCSS